MTASNSFLASRGREEIRKVPEDQGVSALIQLIKEDGRWVDPA